MWKVSHELNDVANVKLLQTITSQPIPSLIQGFPFPVVLKFCRPCWFLIVT